MMQKVKSSGRVAHKQQINLKSQIQFTRNHLNYSRKVTSEESEVVKCWKYTWLGTETDKTNYTSDCTDLESADGPVRWGHVRCIHTWHVSPGLVTSPWSGHTMTSSEQMSLTWGRLRTRAGRRSDTEYTCTSWHVQRHGVRALLRAWPERDLRQVHGVDRQTHELHLRGNDEYTQIIMKMDFCLSVLWESKPWLGWQP